MPEVPDYMSQRRAAALSGLSRQSIARSVPVHGDYNSVAKVDLERLIGRRIEISDWNEATVRLNHAAMARQEADHAAAV